MISSNNKKDIVKYIHTKIGRVLSAIHTWMEKC